MFLHSPLEINKSICIPTHFISHSQIKVTHQMLVFLGSILHWYLCRKRVNKPFSFRTLFCNTKLTFNCQIIRYIPIQTQIVYKLVIFIEIIISQLSLIQRVTQFWTTIHIRILQFFYQITVFIIWTVVWLQFGIVRKISIRRFVSTNKRIGNIIGHLKIFQPVIQEKSCTSTFTRRMFHHTRSIMKHTFYTIT